MPQEERKVTRNAVGPEMEQVKLTAEEEKLFNQIMDDLLPSSRQETQTYLDGHRAESQGQ